LYKASVAIASQLNKENPRITLNYCIPSSKQRNYSSYRDWRYILFQGYTDPCIYNLPQKRSCLSISTQA